MRLQGETIDAKSAVAFAAGVFRFTTGSSDKGADQRETATATIGAAIVTERSGKSRIVLTRQTAAARTARCCQPR